MVNGVESLQYGNAVFGCCRGSFVAKYLVDVLRFHKGNIRTYNSPEEYAHALRSKEIAAAFLEVPFAKLFLAKYCRVYYCRTDLQSWRILICKFSVKGFSLF